MNDTDYAKLCDKLSKKEPSEYLGTILDCIKVVADAKTEKRLWKAKLVCISTLSPIPVSEEHYTDTMELTVDEAVDWYRGWAKHLNDSCNDNVFYGVGGLFYKEYNEWIKYIMVKYEEERKGERDSNETEYHNQ